MSEMSAQQCPGANVALGTRADAVPPCIGLESLVARGEPLAVVSADPRAGGATRSYEEIKQIAAGAGRETLLVRPTVKVSSATEPGWRGTLHAREVVEVVDAGAIRTVCDTGVVVVCGADSVQCVNDDGTVEHVIVDTMSLAKALDEAVGGGAPHVCSTDCVHFEHCSSGAA
ncbi:MAG: hypothetical protein K1X95_05735 [Acidimicrobiia bacterium]|nr:hypothetical protein [Acidimicrobiia bacterium]